MQLNLQFLQKWANFYKITGIFQNFRRLQRQKWVTVADFFNFQAPSTPKNGSLQAKYGPFLAIGPYEFELCALSFGSARCQVCKKSMLHWLVDVKQKQTLSYTMVYPKELKKMRSCLPNLYIQLFQRFNWITTQATHSYYLIITRLL